MKIPAASLRPDPDELLAQVKDQEARDARGKLKIFFGAAPGVGKTYAMLQAAHKAKTEGADLVIGYVEPHMRPETLALLEGLEALPKLRVEYRGAMLQEFDLEAAIQRRPQIIIVDELAHTNAEGLTHAKRWQDVDQLLAAGINVWSTLNVQHLESASDIVARIAGTPIRETIPDVIFEQADEVELVDLPSDDLLARLKEGKVYLPEQVERAVERFFRKGNLIALRELALRKTAERVNVQMENYRSENAIPETWPVSDRLLVCVGPSPFSANLVRGTKRMANSLRASWLAVHVDTPARERLSRAERIRLTANLKLAESLGAETASLSGYHMVDEILRYARKRNVSKIIVGKPQQSRWRDLFRGALVYELTRKCGDIDVYVISGEDRPEPQLESAEVPEQLKLKNYLLAILIVGICTLLGWAMLRSFEPVNLVMVYLVGVLIAGLRLGRGPSVLAAVLGVLAFDFFFIPPYLTFAVHDAEYLITFAVMLVTSLVVSELATRITEQAEVSREREHQTAALYALSRDLSSLHTRHKICESVIEHGIGSLPGEIAIFLADDSKKLELFEGQADLISDKDRGVVDWVFANAARAGLGTGTLPGARFVGLPLQAANETLGVLAFRPTDTEASIEADTMRLLEAMTGQAAAALHRVILAKSAEQARIAVNTERLRNSLLSAVSHDLRTPLTAISGSVSTLIETDLDPATRRDLLSGVLEEADAMNQLISNLLDTTRLEAGAVTLKAEWQSLEEIIGAAIRRLERQLGNRQVIVSGCEEPLMVLADEILLQQVFVNLLDNARKNSPAGSPIEINVSRKNREIQIEIADSGTGLPAGMENQLFEKFFHLSPSGMRAGSGLGLFICKGIVELHGGTIRAANNKKGGASFTFTLPFKELPELEDE